MSNNSTSYYFPGPKSKQEEDLNLAQEMGCYSLHEMNELLVESGYFALFKKFTGYITQDKFTISSDIHGVTHTSRVLYLTFCLISDMNVNPEDSLLLITSALYHDIGRINDWIDDQHGKNSFAKAMQKGYINDFSDDDKEIIRFVIENHCIDDSIIPHCLDSYYFDDHERALRLLYIFKDADGLDRVRLGDLDINTLRFEQSRRLLLVAWQLFSAFN